MNPLEEKIKQISDKAQLLLKQHQVLQRENEKLKKELHDVTSLHAEKAQQMDLLEQKVAVLKAATTNMDDADKKELEKRLNHYIREIDRCIALLSE